MQSVATLLGATNSAQGTTASAMEARVMALAEKAKQESWGCEDPIDFTSTIDNSELESSLRHQGMPQRIIDTLQNQVRETPALEAVKKFTDSPKESWCLVLAGQKGVGKSTAAAYFLWEKTRRVASGATPPKQLQWWTASRVARLSGYDQELEKMMKVPLMVIDDLGVEYLDKNGYFNHRLDELIDERYSNYRKTIITTNLNKRDFQARYEDRITSRIREGFKHGGDYLELDGRSLRI